MTSSVSSSRWLLMVALLVPLWMAGPSTGQAESAHTFKQHYESALRLYDGGQFEGAIREFQAAYALKQLPRLLLNIGQAHRKLGHAKDALGFYEFYLRVEPNPKPEIKAELTSYIDQTRALLDAAERMKAQQEPVAPPPAGEAAAPRSEVTAAAPAASAPVVAVPVPTVVPTAARPAAVTTLQQERRAPEGSAARPVYKKWWFWTLIGVGVAATATGIALGVRATPSADPANIEIRNVF